MNRRDFLKASANTSALPLLTLPVHYVQASTGNASRSIRPGLIISDSRFIASRQFGQEAHKLGLPQHTIRGDITALWYQYLDTTWRKNPLVVAGMTSLDSVFLLEQLANDRQVRLSVRIEHALTPDGDTTHTIRARQSDHDELRQTLTDTQWHRALAHRFHAGISTDRSQPLISSQSTTLATTTPVINPLDMPNHLASQNTTLVSWVMAPAHTIRRYWAS